MVVRNVKWLYGPSVRPRRLFYVDYRSRVQCQNGSCLPLFMTSPKSWLVKSRQNHRRMLPVVVIWEPCLGCRLETSLPPSTRASVRTGTKPRGQPFTLPPSLVHTNSDSSKQKLTPQRFVPSRSWRKVNPPALTEGGESIVSHLRIVDELPWVATGGGDDGGSSRYRDGGAKLSIVSVGGKVSLVGHSGNDTIMTGTAEEREPRKEAAFPVPRLAVQDLLLLGGQLLLEGSNGGHRGVTVKRSTRIRTTRVSAAVASTASTASAAAAGGCGGNGCSDDQHAPVRTVTGGYNMRSGSSSSSSVSGWKRLMPSRPAASANTGTTEDAAAEQGATGGGGDVDAVKLEMAGRADLGEAWEPKPFFLGTSLSPLFPSPPAAPEGEGPGARGEKHRWRTSGRSGEGDVVVFDAVLVELSGDSDVRGDLSLVQSSSVQVRKPLVPSLPAVVFSQSHIGQIR